MRKSDFSKKYDEPKVTLSFHFPKSVYEKLKKVSDYYHIPKQKILNGIIDNNYWEQNLPRLILSDSKQYLELMGAINSIKSDIGMMGKMEYDNNIFAKQYLKLGFQELQGNNENQEEVDLKHIIANQEQILHEIRHLQNDLENTFNPTLDKLWLNNTDRNRDFTF
ncbi:hypothetical protein DY052_05955 [Apilactobacillus timberlakei]|uniref:hypothetical protein n=1 Tax=Apilactobacillus timberlakei TaxID=2008380 RepID=UPI00112BFC30|nr:hypothetical protein [Apilactobacillus timberlakei]TPR14967.1 hypothetical protein DY052_05955 [Apilactobacillus timberlakei]